MASSRSTVSFFARNVVSGRSKSGAIQITTKQTRQSSATPNLSHFRIGALGSSQWFAVPVTSVDQLQFVGQYMRHHNERQAGSINVPVVKLTNTICCRLS